MQIIFHETAYCAQNCIQDNDINCHNPYVHTLMISNLHSDNKNVQYLNNNFFQTRCQKLTNKVDYFEKLPILNYNKNTNNFTMQLQNDSINVMHVFNKNFRNILYDHKTSYFMQLGIQNILLRKIITIGGGKRYMINNHNIIGYNTLLNIPSRNYMNLPHSINIEGEYWNRNVMVTINTYHDLDKIIHFNKPSIINFLQYPDIGYQICAQSIIPYFPEFIGQLKWKKFSYNKNKKKIKNIFNNAKNNKYSLCLGIGYQPIPMLKFNVDSIFENNQYINTTFKVTLNYRFDVSFIKQITNQHYYSFHAISKDAMAILIDNMSSTFVEPLIPNFVTEVEHCYKQQKSLESILEISGFLGEIKTIQINNNNNLPIIWNVESLLKHGGKISFLNDNTYAVQLPTDPIVKKHKIFISYTIQNNNIIDSSQQSSTYVVPISINDNSINQNSDSLNTYDNVSHDLNTENENDLYYFDNICKNKTPKKKLDPDNQQKSSINDFYKIEDDASSSSYSKYLKQSNNDKIFQDSSMSKDNQNSCNIPTPPPFKDVLTTNSKLLSSTPVEHKLTTHSTESSASQQDTCNDNSNNFMVSTINNATDQIQTQFDVNTTINKKDLLLMQLSYYRQSKFSEIGTPEYIEKLEKSIKERKKDRCLSDITKLFQKLHPTSSTSSLNESVKTDDSSFSSFQEPM